MPIGQFKADGHFSLSVGPYLSQKLQYKYYALTRRVAIATQSGRGKEVLWVIFYVIAGSIRILFYRGQLFIEPK